MESVQFRDASDLYTILSVDYVWLVLKSTKEQVDLKRNEVRELISLRYHDLIDSADAIVGMDRTVEDFKALVRDVELSSKALLQSKSSLLSQSRVRRESSLERLGGDNWLFQLEQADVLTQAAVNIWESIDARDLSTACELYLEAERAHKSLQQVSSQQGKSNEQNKLHLHNIFQADDLDELGVDAVQSQELQDLVLPAADSDLDPQQDIHNLYPFLRSHWAQIERARDKVVEEADAVLKREDMNTESTAGAIKALLVLAGVNPEESMDRLLQARSELLTQVLNVDSEDNTEQSKDSSVDRLVRALTVVVHTIADCAQLYSVQEQRVEESSLRHRVTEWIERQSLCVKRQATVILACIEDLEGLDVVQRQLVELERIGGSTLTDVDFSSWRALYEGVVERRLWEGSKDGVFLYNLLFAESFTEKAVDLLHVSFKAVCLDLQNSVEKALASSQATEREQLGDGGDAVMLLRSASDRSLPITAASALDDVEEEEDDAVLDESEVDEKAFALLGNMILSEDAVDRARAAVFLLQDFNAELYSLGVSMNHFADSISFSPGTRPREQMLNLLHVQCRNALIDLEKGLDRPLEQALGVFQDAVSGALVRETMDREEKEKENDVNTHDREGAELVNHLKRALFLSRVAQGIKASQDLLRPFVSKEGLEQSSQVLTVMTLKTHTIFADCSLILSKGVLEGSLRAQEWAFSRDWKMLFGGWERISINLLQGDDDADLDDEDATEDADLSDTVALPGTVSSGVAMFSFLLSKQIRIIGDSRFISSGSVLALSISASGAVRYGTMSGKLVGRGSKESGTEPWLEPFLEAAASAFCSASQQAILELADKSLFLVKDLYVAHIERHASTPNEAAALQTIFDLHWFDWLLFVRDRVKENPLQGLIDTVVESDHIDIVNWSIYEQLLLNRVKTYRERNALLFGPILAVKAYYERMSSDKTPLMVAPSLEGASAYDSNNVLHLGYLANRTVARIPLLPIPTSFRTLQQKRNMQRKRASSSSRTLLASPTGQASSAKSSGFPAGSEASAAFKVMGQVGSNLFSQASSWLKPLQ